VKSVPRAESQRNVPVVALAKLPLAIISQHRPKASNWPGLVSKASLVRSVA
jgi:hypothetical protein